jgi:hypothetical protein
MAAKAKGWLAVAAKATLIVILVAFLGNSTFGVWVQCKFFDSSACAPKLRFVEFISLEKPKNYWSAKNLKLEYGYKESTFSEKNWHRAYRFRLENIGIGQAGQQEVIVKWLPDFKKGGNIRKQVILYGCRRSSGDHNQVINCSKELADSIVTVRIEPDFFLEKPYLFFFTQGYTEIELALGFPSSPSLQESIPRLAILSMACSDCQERQISLTLTKEKKGELP